MQNNVSRFKSIYFIIPFPNTDRWPSGRRRTPGTRVWSNPPRVRISSCLPLKFTCKFSFGALAQLGERFAGSEEVSGSIPLCSTITSSLLLGTFKSFIILIILFKIFKDGKKGGNFYKKYTIHTYLIFQRLYNTYKVKNRYIQYIFTLSKTVK